MKAFWGRLTATKIIVCGYLLIILCGALLLSLPVSSQAGTLLRFWMRYLLQHRRPVLPDWWYLILQRIGPHLDMWYCLR